MSQRTVNLICITVHIKDGKTVFDPPPGKRGYQFGKGVARGSIVFTLASKEFQFCGCSFHPEVGGMPGVQARWGLACRHPQELAVTFDFPGGALHEGNLHLEYFHRDTGKTGIIDPQVGNDGQT